MKRSISLLAFCGILFGSVCFVSCGGSSDKKEPTNETTPVKPDSTKTSAYVCPMGPSCGKGDVAGKCPGCGMDMVKNDKGVK